MPREKTITWDFTGFNQKLTPKIVGIMFDIVTTVELKVSSTSPEVITSGYFKGAKFSLVIDYSTASNFSPTNFKSNGAFHRK
ncbi:MAG: hypothetical protein ACRCR9_04390 [Chitinophagaceae bacterium]